MTPSDPNRRDALDAKDSSKVPTTDTFRNKVSVAKAGSRRVKLDYYGEEWTYKNLPSFPG